MRISGYLGWNLGRRIKQQFQEICKLNGIGETDVHLNICVDGERRNSKHVTLMTSDASDGI